MTVVGDRARAVPRTAFLIALLCASACGRHVPSVAATPPPASPSAPPAAPSTTVTGLNSLRATLDGLLASPELSRGSWGVAVRSLTRSEALYTSNAQRLLMPASTAKLVTLAVAARQLGWDFRFRTRLLARGAVADGALDGDLIIVGSGDPTFDDWDGAGTRQFIEWAAALKAMGITRVRGRIIGDDNVFDDDGLGSGWAWDDVAASYSGATSGLQFNQDTAQLIVSPGPSDGLPPHLEVRPSYVTLQVRNLATTSASGPGVMVRPLPRSTAIEVSGSVAPGAAALVVNVSVPNPTLYFAAAARDGLTKAGITIEGDAIDVDDLPVAVPPTDVLPVAETLSAPLAEFSRTMMLLSQNVYAETLLKTLAARTGGPGTTAAGRDIVRHALEGLGITPQDATLVDGSGLSRYNLMTADAMVRVLDDAYRDTQLREPFLASLPRAGVDGTLAGRMKGTPAEQNARAKTGSLSNARCVAGYVTTADGEVLAFAVMANHFNIPNIVVDRTSDAIVATLAGFSRR